MDLQEQSEAGGRVDGRGVRASATTVDRLLHDLGYRLQALQKTLQGASHSDRNAQFEYINEAAVAFLRRQQPLISVDTKKKEAIRGLQDETAVNGSPLGSRAGTRA